MTLLKSPTGQTLPACTGERCAQALRAACPNAKGRILGGQGIEGQIVRTRLWLYDLDNDSLPSRSMPSIHRSCYRLFIRLQCLGRASRLQLHCLRQLRSLYGYGLIPTLPSVNGQLSRLQKPRFPHHLARRFSRLSSSTHQEQQQRPPGPFHRSQYLGSHSRLGSKASLSEQELTGRIASAPTRMRKAYWQYPARRGRL